MTAPLATPLILPSALTNKVADSGSAPTQAAKLETIIEESNRLQGWCARRFDERIDTLYFDVLSARAGGPIVGRELYLSDDLRTLTTLTNGDGTAITSNYTLLPRSADVYGVAAKRSILLSSTSGVFWSPGVNDWREAISVVGTWGYGGQWKAVTASGVAVTTNEALDDSEIGVDVTAGTQLEAGMVLKIDSEYMYVESVASNTATVARAYNGSTAVSHTTSTAIYRWEALPLVQRLVQRLVAISVSQDSSPLFGQIVIGDATAAVTTDGSPQDVRKDAMRLRPAPMPMGV